MHDLLFLKSAAAPQKCLFADVISFTPETWSLNKKRKAETKKKKGGGQYL